MILKQFYLNCLAHASYIIVDERTKVAAVIDPQRDIDQYIEEAEKHGASIKYVFLTHFHADFIAGHLELRERVGAHIYLGAQAQAEYEFGKLRDGDVLEFGDVRLQIRETPGHTPEGISIVVFDLAQSEEQPLAAFTGDTLFVGDVGRPDLMASVGASAQELAGMLYDSLHQKLMTLPDETLVYPAHGAGSMCGKNLGSETFTTIGEQRKSNYALQPMSKQEFRDVVTSEQPQAPAYFGYDAMMNKMEHSTLEDNLALAMVPMALDEVLQQRADGSLIVDVRDGADFAASHLAGSLNLGLDGKFATWAGTLLHNRKEKKIILIAPPGSEREAAMRLGRIGTDYVIGYLEGGIEALSERPELLASNERISGPALMCLLQEPDAPLVIDVRTKKEWESGHIENSVNIPLAQLEDRMQEVPRDRSFAIVCRTDYRSAIAASLLHPAGYPNSLDLIGGMQGWIASELPSITLEKPACQA